MRKLENFITFLLALAVTFELFQWPYTGVLLLVSLGGLSVYQFPVSFLHYALTLRQPWWVAFNLISSLIFALFPVAILFLIMHWPALGIMLDICVFGSPVLLGISIVYFLKAKEPEQRVFARNRLFRAVIATLIALYLMRSYLLA